MTISRGRKEKAGRQVQERCDPPWDIFPESMKLFIPKGFYGDELWAHNGVLPLYTAVSPTHPGNTNCPEPPPFSDTYYVLETWTDSLHISALSSLTTAQKDEGYYL